jgi:hypothetical protein
MPKRLTTEDALARLAQLRAGEASDLAAELRPLLKHRSNFVIAKAAALAEERDLAELATDLAAAFPYFMQDCVKRDPGCSAKLAIVNALSRFHDRATDVFIAGVQHVQLEPAWGGPVDTAATMRGLCGRALMAFGHPDAFRWHAVLLADPEPMTRGLAVETLAGVQDERAELLLRAKIAREPDDREPFQRDKHAREPERGIEMDAFDALMKVAPDESFEFVAGYLRDADPDRIRAAALALGASHHPNALPTLTGRWRASDDDTRALLALPIALVRSDESWAFLLDELEADAEPVAESIVEALAIFREDADRATAVRRAVDHRGGRRLQQTYKRHFEPAP